MNQQLNKERVYLTAKDLEDLNLDELVKVDATTKEDIASIEYQIGLSLAKKQETGVGYTYEWLARARYSLRMKKALLQTIQEYKSKARRQKGTTFERIFMDIAHQYLPEDTFKELLALAHKEQDAGSGNNNDRG